MAGLAFASLAFASEAMPVAQQNALVQKYCAVCHTDAVKNGGLSLEHFDAADAIPSLAAMMVSKLTSGVLLHTVQAVPSDPDAAAFTARQMRGGAMGAAGIPIPDQQTVDALMDALASEAAGAEEWHLNRKADPVLKGTSITASILRELPSPGYPGRASMYRLVLTCDTATHEGGMQLAWAPLPTRGTLSATVDGKPPVTYTVEGSEKMGNGSRAITGPAALSLFDSKKSAGHRVLLPANALRIDNLFPNESVEFPFRDLDRAARQSLAPCFMESN